MINYIKISFKGVKFHYSHNSVPISISIKFPADGLWKLNDKFNRHSLYSRACGHFVEWFCCFHPVFQNTFNRTHRGMNTECSSDFSTCQSWNWILLSHYGSRLKRNLQCCCQTRRLDCTRTNIATIASIPKKMKQWVTNSVNWGCRYRCKTNIRPSLLKCNNIYNI